MNFKNAYLIALDESKFQLEPRRYKVLRDAAIRPLRTNRQGQVINLMTEIERHARRQLKNVAITWDIIIQWLKDHWQDILKLIISLVIVFL